MHRSAEVRLWARTRWLALALLMVWLAVSVAGPWFARELNAWQVFGFPAGYWVAAQGALLAFLVIIVVCIWRMERLEDHFEAEIAAQGQAETGPYERTVESTQAP